MRNAEAYRHTETRFSLRKNALDPGFMTFKPHRMRHSDLTVKD